MDWNKAVIICLEMHILLFTFTLNPKSPDYDIKIMITL